MIVEIEEITQISKMLVSIKESLATGSIQKRWFNTKELSEYLGYKRETILSKVKKNDFLLGIHYYKQGGLLLFDKLAVDNWVMGIRSTNDIAYENDKINSTIEDILSSIAA